MKAAGYKIRGDQTTKMSRWHQIGQIYKTDLGKYGAGRGAAHIAAITCNEEDKSTSIKARNEKSNIQLIAQAAKAAAAQRSLESRLAFMA